VKPDSFATWPDILTLVQLFEALVALEKTTSKIGTPALKVLLAFTPHPNFHTLNTQHLIPNTDRSITNTKTLNTKH
jgi:hypothetical protein